MPQVRRDGMPDWPQAPGVRAVHWRDIGDALAQGASDFAQAPVYGLFFGAVFALGGLLVVALLSLIVAPWMILPLMLGFPLIGPFAATGLYEVSRRLGVDAPLGWRQVLIAVFAQREREMGFMAFLVMLFFWVWIYLARILIALFFGFAMPDTLSGFAVALFTTQTGILFLITGSAVGSVLALGLFSATVVAIPLLIDSEVDFVTAIATSFRVVMLSPLVMLGWGLIVTILSVVAMVPAFLGLLVILPVLGHATWHIYTRAVVADR